MRASIASEQTYRQLTDALQRGVYGPGARLPAERTLAAQYGVSRETLRNALNRLADEHLVESVVGSGWFVAPEVVGEPPSVLQTFTEMARARGLRPTAHVLRRRVRPATLPEADQLRDPAGRRGPGPRPAARDGAHHDLPGRDRAAARPRPLPCATPTWRTARSTRSSRPAATSACTVPSTPSGPRSPTPTSPRSSSVAAGWPVLVGEEVGYTRRRPPRPRRRDPLPRRRVPVPGRPVPPGLSPRGTLRPRRRDGEPAVQVGGERVGALERGEVARSPRGPRARPRGPGGRSRRAARPGRAVVPGGDHQGRARAPR